MMFLLRVGWCVWFFTVLAGAALLVVNTKLLHIVRYVTRGGHVHRLKPGVFWFNRCTLLSCSSYVQVSFCVSILPPAAWSGIASGLDLFPVMHGRFAHEYRPVL